MTLANVILVGAALMLAPTAASADPIFPRHPTPAQVTASLAAYGAGATVNALYDQNRWDYVSDEIGRGGAVWVDLAVKLAPGADAGTAEGLPISLAFALPLNAPAVLAAVRSGTFDVGDVCGAPFIEDSVRDVPGYIRKATAAVNRVSDPALAATRTACLQALAKAG